MTKQRQLAKGIAEIILNELKIYSGQEMIDDDAYSVSTKIVDKLSIDIQKEDEKSCNHEFVIGHNPGDEGLRCEWCGERP